MKYSLALIFTLLFAAGCSSNPASLNRDTLKANKVSVVDLLSTDTLTHEIYDSSHTAGATGGLLGLAVSAGVDATINSRRTVAFAPILTALGNYDTKKIFAAKLKGLQGPSFDSDIRVNATAMPVNAFPKPPPREPKVLSIASKYTLGPNHQYVTAVANTLLKATPESAPYKRAYKATANIDIGGQVGINVTQLLISQPELLKQATESAMDRLIKDIEQDLNVGPARP